MLNKQKYNAGDWVKDKRYPEHGWVKLGEAEETSNGRIVYNIGNDKYFWQRDILEKWEPKIGEYCWFYKKDSYNPVFAKFNRFLPPDNNLGVYVATGFIPNGTDRKDDEEFGYFYSCAPFIGKLPEGLK